MSLATLGLARGAAAGLGLLAVLVLARVLAPEELGRWSLALAVQGYALHLGEFGLRAVVTTEAAHAGRRLPALLARYLRLRLALTAPAFAIAVAGCAVWWPGDLVLVALTTLAIVPVALQLDWLALVDGRIGIASVLLLARPAAFLALLGFSPVPLGPLGVATCFLVAWMVAAALSWLALRRPAAAAAGVVSTAHQMLRRGGRLAAVALSNQLQLSADLIAVGWAVGAAAAGDYWLASQVLIAGLVFANAAGQMTLARLPTLAGDPLAFARAVTSETSRITCLALVGAVVAGLTAPPLVPLLFGTDHATAVTVLLWLLPWFVLQHPTTVLQAALSAAGRESVVLRANALAIVVLVAALAMATTTRSLAAFALARSAAEATRLVVLLVSLAPFGRSSRRGCQISTSA